MRRYALVVLLALSTGCSEPTPATPPPSPPPEVKTVTPPSKTKVIVTEFRSPLGDQGWTVNSYAFGEVCSYETADGSKKNWGKHLGEDCNVKPGTPVHPIAPGKVSYVGEHLGQNKDKRNWGGIVILGHWISETEAVYSLYGHLDIRDGLEKGQMVTPETKLGTVAAALTPENGWWEDAHLHLQVCLDPDDVYRGGVLRGYASDKAPNRLEDHIAPTQLFHLFKPGITIKQLMTE